MMDGIRLGDYTFRHICRIEPDRNADGSIQEHMPQSRYLNRRGLSVHADGKGPFCRFCIPKRYNVSGVYALTADDRLRYIGECISLSSRFNNGYGQIAPRNCFKGGQATNCWVNNQILLEAQRGSRLDLWFFDNDDHKATEKDLLRGPKPPWNRV